MKFGIVVFPGSNCDRDMQYALETDLGAEVRMLWHKDRNLEDFDTQDCIVLPGGFSYGDYLRCGAMARYSPVMNAVVEHARRGGKVLGICNGFQILCEAHLLPGALLANDHQKFICDNIYIRSENHSTVLTQNVMGKALKIPIAHGEGRYFADDKTLQALEDNDQVLFRYCDRNGEVSLENNPNGSLHNIAGICNAERNVFGMMPHPERACSTILKNTDGVNILKGLMNN